MKNLILTEPVLDGQQVGPVTINIDGGSTTANILDSILNGQGSEIHVTVDEGLQIIGLEDLTELAALLADIEAKVAEVLLALDTAVELANQTLADLNAAMADLQALVARAELAAKNAKDSETAAKASELASRASEVAAEAAAAAALVSEQAALASEIAAGISQDAAKVSETNSKASEDAAALSEQSATSSAASALESKNAAKVSETNSKASETAAGVSEANALESATSASVDAAAALASKNAAKASELAAATSATEAQASEAAAEASKVSAATSASAAQTSQEAAALNESNSGLAAVSANDSKNLSKKYANAPEDTVVETGHYSALHWAEKAKKYAQQVFVSAGTFTPTTAVQYPDITSVTRDTIWMIKLPTDTHTFTYTTGSLTGTTVTGGDFLFYDTPANTWEHIPVGLVGILEINGKTGQSVELTAQDVGALPITGGILTGALTVRAPITSKPGNGYGMAIGGTPTHSWISPVKADGTIDNANQLSFDPATGIWSAAGNKIYTAGQAPKFTDLADYSSWLAANSGKIRVGGNTDLIAGADNKGFLPRKEGTGASAVSYLGSSAWWFQDAWVNQYNGGSIAVTGTASARSLILPDWGIQQHASNKNLEVRKEAGNVLALQILSSDNSAHFAGQLFENSTDRVYSTGNKPSAVDVEALPLTGGTLAGTIYTTAALALARPGTSDNTGLYMEDNRIVIGSNGANGVQIRPNGLKSTLNQMQLSPNGDLDIGGKKVFKQGWDFGLGNKQGFSADAVSYTEDGTRDFNQLLTAGEYSVSGEWLNGITNIPTLVPHTGTCKVEVRNWSAGNAYVQTFSAASSNNPYLTRKVRKGTGTPDAVTWDSWMSFSPYEMDLGHRLVINRTNSTGAPYITLKKREMRTDLTSGWYNFGGLEFKQGDDTFDPNVPHEGPAGAAIWASRSWDNTQNRLVMQLRRVEGGIASEVVLYENNARFTVGGKIMEFNGEFLFIDGKKAYHEGHRPTAEDIGAAPSLPTKSVFVPTGTTAQRPVGGDFPAGTVALRYNSETSQWEGVNSSGEVLPLGGGGDSSIPPFISRTSSFTVVKNQAYSLSMVDGVTKTVTVPRGFSNTDWFAVDFTKWDRGLAGLVANIVFEGDVLTNGTADYTSLTIDRPCVAYFQKVGGKWQWVDGVGINGSYNALETRIDEISEDSGWVNITEFLPGYSQYPGPAKWTVRCRRKAGVVYLSGVVGAVAGASQPVLLLPAGFRPSIDGVGIFSTMNNQAESGSGPLSRLEIDAGGKVFISNKANLSQAAWFSVSCSFPI